MRPAPVKPAVPASTGGLQFYRDLDHFDADREDHAYPTVWPEDNPDFPTVAADRGDSPAGPRGDVGQARLSSQAAAVPPSGTAAATGKRQQREADTPRAA